MYVFEKIFANWEIKSKLLWSYEPDIVGAVSLLVFLKKTVFSVVATTVRSLIVVNNNNSLCSLFLIVWTRSIVVASNYI